jgi:hypothetical protein
VHRNHITGPGEVDAVALDEHFSGNAHDGLCGRERLNSDVLGGSELSGRRTSEGRSEGAGSEHLGSWRGIEVFYIYDEPQIIYRVLAD